ncbi:GNAT family N-acetyltransferase [Microvirga pudoricolor]|uniref:GNAT family N-acetyltransferase n=1 Tax=Microvirga pudoricolor TaxID=2778729 RepID=UPI00194F8E47|nr:GNAT family N-acetyltransferase [Microvirga pudoricolor]MBM6594305.1 GNAT family N-acetyltransferase [Microvirga pudoricolor]
MSPASQGLTIKVMEPADLDLAVEWAAAEGWNPGLDDAACFRAADPDGFLIARLEGQPVGSISVVRYPGGFGFLGFYILRPEFRGRGYGMSLWRAGLACLEGCTIGLDGVVAQQDNYARSGFRLAHRNIRYGGAPVFEPSGDPRLRSITPDWADAVLAYDRAFFPGSREAFLGCWLAPGTRRSLALVENGSIQGYGVVRACRNGHKIGPLFAEGPGEADLLFRALAAEAGGGPVFLDLPEPNRDAVALAERHGLAPVFETARMYRGRDPRLPLSKIYGITTFELG